MKKRIPLDTVLLRDLATRRLLIGLPIAAAVSLTLASLSQPAQPATSSIAAGRPTMLQTHASPSSTDSAAAHHFPHDDASATNVSDVPTAGTPEAANVPVLAESGTVGGTAGASGNASGSNGDSLANTQQDMPVDQPINCTTCNPAAGSRCLHTGQQTCPPSYPCGRCGSTGGPVHESYACPMYACMME